MAVSNQTNAHGARKFPGIDLHLHLDGALTPEMLLTLGALSGTNLPAQTPEALRPFVTVDERCTSLVEYLERFNVTLSVLQTREAIAEAVRMLLLRLHEQGLLYAEIRFAPQLHLQRGLTQCQVVEAATEGLLKAGAQCAPLKAQLILCCMRFDENRSENLETIRTAAAFLGRGVCAADLAGGEIGHPATAYAEAFELAAKLTLDRVLSMEGKRPGRRASVKRCPLAPNASATACMPLETRRCLPCWQSAKSRWKCALRAICIQKPFPRCTTIQCGIFCTEALSQQSTPITRAFRRQPLHRSLTAYASRPA